MKRGMERGTEKGKHSRTLKRNIPIVVTAGHVGVGYKRAVYKAYQREVLSRIKAVQALRFGVLSAADLKSIRLTPKVNSRLLCVGVAAACAELPASLPCVHCADAAVQCFALTRADPAPALRCPASSCRKNAFS